jgi:hypothetical protein
MFTVNTIKIIDMIFIVEGFELLKIAKIVKTMFVAKMLLLRSLLLKDVVARVLTRRCCCQKIVNVDVKNVDAKGWLMLILETLLPKDIATCPRCCCKRCCQIKTLLQKMLQ